MPSSPGYFGVIQLCFLTVLKLFVPQEEAGVFAASVYYHLAQYIPVTIVGLIFLGMTGFRMSDMQSVAAAESTASKLGDGVAGTSTPNVPAVADGGL